MEYFLQMVSQFLWGPGTLMLLLGTGLFLTIRMRFLPWRNLGYALRCALGREARQAGRDGVSPFSALMTALAATIGTGNIVGVATALTAGGWMPRLSRAFAGTSQRLPLVFREIPHYNSVTLSNQLPEVTGWETALL